MRRAVSYFGCLLAGLVIALMLVSGANVLADTPRLIVTSVLPDSPAEKVGLKEGDRLLVYDDKPLSSVAVLQAAQHNTVTKKEVTLKLLRGEEVLTFTVPTGMLGVALKVELSAAADTLFERGVAADRERRIDAAIADWTLGAKIAHEQGDKLGAAWLYEQVGLAYQRQGRFKDAQDAYETAGKLFDETGDGAGYARMLEAMAFCSQAQRDFSTATRFYNQALDVNKAAGNNLWAAGDLMNLAEVAQITGDSQATHSYFMRAVEIFQTHAPGSEALANALDLVGRFTASGGDLKAAHDYFRASLEIRERLLPDSMLVAASLENLGVLEGQRGDPKAAQGYLTRALGIHERLFPDSPPVAITLTNLGKATGQQGDPKGAQKYFGRALQIRERMAPESLPVADSLDDLGRATASGGDTKAAKAYFTRAQEIRQRIAPDSLLVAISFDNLGQTQAADGDLKAARDYHKKALAIRQRVAPDSLLVADSFHLLGHVSFSLNEVQTAIDYQKSSLAIRERLSPGSMFVAENLDDLGGIANARGDLQAAQEYHSLALKIHERVTPNTLALANSLNNVGNIARARGDLQTAQEYHNRALAICEWIAPNSPYMADTYGLLGITAALSGDLQTAQDFFSRDLAIRKRLDPRSPEAASTFSNLGNIAGSRGDLQTAQNYYTNALDIRQKLVPDTLEVAISLSDLGNVAGTRGDLETAQKNFKRALEIREKMAPGTLEVAASYDDLGALAASRDDLETARSHFRRALEIREKQAPGSLDVAASLNNLGSVYFSLKDLKSARDYHTRGLEIRKRLAPGSLGMAGALCELGHIALEERSFQEAIDYFNKSIGIVEAQRSGIVSPNARAFLIDRYTHPYSGLLRAQIALNDLPAAFATYERARSRTLVELLSERRLNFRPEIPPELLKEQEDSDVKRSIASVKLAKLDKEKEKDAEQIKKLQAELQAELAAHAVEQQKLEERIRRAAPKPSTVEYPKPLGLKETQDSLDAGTLLLAYFVDDDETYLFAVTKTDMKVFTLPVGGESLDRQVSVFQGQITKLRLGNPDALGAKLYDLLIRPAQEWVNRAERVLICPDGPLHYMPFAALVSNAKPSVRYFIDDKPMHMIVSMTVYDEIRKQAAQRAKREMRVLAFGDAVYTDDQAKEVKKRRIGPQAQPPDEPKKQAIKSDPEVDNARRRFKLDVPLPASKEEVDTIASLFGEAATIWRSEEANEERAKKESKDYTILHFAAHGWLNEEIGMDSAIVLSQPELLGRAWTKEDNGMLQAWEIFEQVRLDADLVVLSACETGVGQTIRGEGLIGLTRAFQYAGARSIIVSLWAVTDNSTATLMKAFYQELLRGTSKDVALQRAIAVVRSNPKWRRPSYWSPFILIGDWQ